MSKVRAVLTNGLLALSLAAGLQASARAGEAVSRDEFEKLVAQFEKFRAENAQLKGDNAQLRKDLDALRAGAKGTPIQAALDKYVEADELKPFKQGLDAVKSGTTKFVLAGYSAGTYMDRNLDSVTGVHVPSTFIAQFNPIFLWKLSDQLSFQGELEFQTEDGATSLNLEYAELVYKFHDYLTFSAGKFLTPFARFNPGLHPLWINKLPDKPLVFQDGGLAPELEVGAKLSGGFDAGPTKFNWALYTSNGSSLDTGVADATTAGTLGFDNTPDINRNKAVGGRLGFLPIPELELGGSIQWGRAGPGQSRLSNVTALLYAADFSFTKSFDHLKGQVDIRGEWVWSRVSRGLYSLDFGDGNGPQDVLFDNNRRNGGYLQFAYRPSKFDQKWIKNLEAVFRYDRIENPSAPRPELVTARQFVTHDRQSLGVNYWLGPSAVLKFAYETDSHDHRSVLMQFGMGF